MLGLENLMPEIQAVALVVNVVLVLVIMPLRSAIARLESSDDALSVRIQHLELKLAENYVRRDEVTQGLNEISRRLERFEALLSARISNVEAEKK